MYGERERLMEGTVERVNPKKVKILEKRNGKKNTIRNVPYGLLVKLRSDSSNSNSENDIPEEYQNHKTRKKTSNTGNTKKTQK